MGMGNLMQGSNAMGRLGASTIVDVLLGKYLMVLMDAILNVHPIILLMHPAELVYLLVLLCLIQSHSSPRPRVAAHA